MSQRWRFICSILLGFALFALPHAAQAQGGTDDLWQTAGQPEGLPSASILAALRAQDGTLWFGTEAGAVHFDGRWTALGASAGAPAGRVRALAQAADGALWLGGEAGLAYCPAGRTCRSWTGRNGLPNSDVRALLADGQGQIWAGTASGLVHLPAAGDGKPATVPQLDGVGIWALADDGGGGLWIGTEKKGLWHYQPGQAGPVPEADALLGIDIYALLIDHTGRLWAGGEGGVWNAGEGGWQRFALPAAGEPRVFALAEDDADGLWMGTDQGAYYLASWFGVPVQQFTARDGLASDFVRAVALDDEGGAWFGTNAGVSRFAGRNWQVVREGGLAGQRINALLTDHAGRTWVGTERSGLAMWDGSAWHLFGLQGGQAEGRVVALFEDRQGRIWLGTDVGAGYLVCETRACTGSVRWSSLGISDGLPAVPVLAIAEDEAGRVWLGTNKGTTWWDERTGLHRAIELADWRINAIYRGQDDALWFGTHEHGLWRLAGGTWQVAPGSEQLPFTSITVDGLAQGNDGALWVGTYDARLWRYASGRWQQLDDSPANPGVLSLAGASDSVWVGTYTGLSRFDGRTWQLYTGRILPNLQVLALAPGNDGTCWIGTAAGLVRYVPGRRPPWVQVEAINLAVPAGGQVTLQGDQLREVRLIGGDLATRPADLIYLIDVLGVPGSRQVATDRLVAYQDLNLAPGMYTLRVQARDRAFNYSTPVDIKLRVVAPVPHVNFPWGSSLPASLFYPLLGLGTAAILALATAGTALAWTRKEEQRRATLLAERQSEALARHFNPYISGEPVRQVSMFFGRQELLGKMINALHVNSIMVVGERRIGKTSLLLQLGEVLEQVEDPQWAFLPVYVDLEGTPEECFFFQLMEEIAGVVARHLPALPDLRVTGHADQTDYSDRDFIADLRALLQPLRASFEPRTVRLILLLDEMDVLSQYDIIVQQQLRRIFMTNLAQNLGAVVAGVGISKEWDRLESPWYNMFNQMALEPFSPDDARRLLVEPVQGVYEWASAALDLVLQRADGRPHQLQQIALQAVNHMLADARTTITLDDVQAAEPAM